MFRVGLSVLFFFTAKPFTGTSELSTRFLHILKDLDMFECALNPAVYSCSRHGIYIP